MALDEMHRAYPRFDKFCDRFGLKTVMHHFHIREEADYESVEVSKKRTKRTLAKASDFIEKLQEVYET